MATSFAAWAAEDVGVDAARNVGIIAVKQEDPAASFSGVGVPKVAPGAQVAVVSLATDGRLVFFLECLQLAIAFRLLFRLQLFLQSSLARRIFLTPFILSVLLFRGLACFLLFQAFLLLIPLTLQCFLFLADVFQRLLLLVLFLFQ